MIKYSIIVPVYNAQKHLEKCVSSILRQLVTEFELILVDDGSTDESLQQCYSFAKADPRVIVIHQENSGVSAARNAGLNISRGEFILFVDSDDYVDDEYLSIIDSFAGDFDLLEFGNFDMFVDEEGTEQSIHPSKLCLDLEGNENNELHWKELIKNTFFAAPWNKLFKKELVKHRFDEDCVCYEDFIFNIRYFEEVRSFKVISNPIYYYRQSITANAIAKRQWSKRFDISRKVAAAVDHFIRIRNVSSNISSLYLYPYGAFLTELRVAEQKGKSELNSATKYIVRDVSFRNVVSKLQNVGTKIEVLKLLIKYRNYALASLWLRRVLI